jgi:hypothetical protein
MLKAKHSFHIHIIRCDVRVKNFVKINFHCPVISMVNFQIEHVFNAGLCKGEV